MTGAGGRWPVWLLVTLLVLAVVVLIPLGWMACARMFGGGMMGAGMMGGGGMMGMHWGGLAGMVLVVLLLVVLVVLLLRALVGRRGEVPPPREAGATPSPTPRDETER